MHAAPGCCPPSTNVGPRDEAPQDEDVHLEVRSVTATQQQLARTQPPQLTMLTAAICGAESLLRSSKRSIMHACAGCILLTLLVRLWRCVNLAEHLPRVSAARASDTYRAPALTIIQTPINQPHSVRSAQDAAASAAPAGTAKPKRAAQITKSYEESRWEDMQRHAPEH